MLCFPFLFFFLHTRGWKANRRAKQRRRLSGFGVHKKSRTFKYTESVCTVPVSLLFFFFSRVSDISLQNQKNGAII